jgi:hypothetical protein
MLEGDRAFFGSAVVAWEGAVACSAMTAVIGSVSGYPITPDFLSAMTWCWF